PFETAVSCYTYDIDGQAYADHVQLQLEAQMAQTAGAAPLGIEVSAPALLRQISGEGKVWLDENGLPLRQKVDMHMPEADEYYDADVRMVIDYTFDETAVAAVQAAIAADASFLPTPAEIVESAAASLPSVLVFVLFLTIAVLLIALRRRRWMYSFFAISITVIMLGTPILQIINAELFLARRAYAAGAAETLADTFVAEEEIAVERPSTTSASQTLITQAMSPMTQAYQPDTYCGSGGNGDRDGDTLADDAEYCLGTNPNLADSDGDGIADGVEVAGFEYGQTISQTWYSDPTSMDTNQDGVSDGLEWAQSANGLAKNWDLDQDGIPNLYDTDDDGDGVGDERDISPASYTEYFSVTQSLPKPPLIPFLPPLLFPIFNLNPEPVTATKEVTAPVGLNITGQYNGYVYVDLQVQPQDLDHLRFGATPLDWGYDNKGQIQEHNTAVDEDISLIPMLVVESNVAPNVELAKEYNVTPYQDIDGDGYGELMMPLYRVGDAGIIEAFHAHMAYGPDALAALDEEGVHWRNAHIVWVVRGQFDKEAEDGTRSQQELTIHTYEEPATRITGWEVTKSGAFESAIFGTPQFPNDDRALFQLAFGLHQIYLENPQVDLDEIKARFSGANTPIADKWGITTTLAIDLPLEAYAHSDAGVADINNRIKS
ncbi:MAG: hypothetical protein KC421_30405, partial [Anaerolineales bacterium]|nr:hypothetical protein [Anaerolineales bacterium]